MCILVCARTRQILSSVFQSLKLQQLQCIFYTELRSSHIKTNENKTPFLQGYKSLLELQHSIPLIFRSSFFHFSIQGEKLAFLSCKYFDLYKNGASATAILAKHRLFLFMNTLFLLSLCLPVGAPLAVKCHVIYINARGRIKTQQVDDSGRVITVKSASDSSFSVR